SDARRFRYVHQLAFYQNVLNQVIGQLVPVYIIAVEKKEPFRCGVWQLPSETLFMASNEIEGAMERLRTATREDKFETGYEELRYLFLN
ncbi:MAG: PD-(D/E)XK nuclease-like domain-containing protein, partial [Planctomycetaceae bacterium]|nr:PD-(D/E)XK nuclease-like domain-containing protein [Planctomycetaceae bacterium]